MIAAGRLDTRIGLLAPQQAQNAAGETLTSYRTAWTVWAHVKPEAVTETVNNGPTVARVRYAITTRYRDDINETWCIDLDGRRLAIAAVVEKGRREELLITATEVRP